MKKAKQAITLSQKVFHRHGQLSLRLCMLSLVWYVLKKEEVYRFVLLTV